MIDECIRGVRVRLYRTEGLFSPRGIDAGTRAMLENCALEPGQKVLDLGCGAGGAGIYAAKICGAVNVRMCDIDPSAVEAARENARANGLEIEAAVSDGLQNVPDADFDWILTNPPYQSDFAVAKRFIEKGFNRLKIGGRMAMVVKRREWYENKLRAIFGGVKTISESGYFVFIAERRSARYANKPPRT